jgi:hypothetical protein
MRPELHEMHNVFTVWYAFIYGMYQPYTGYLG